MNWSLFYKYITYVQKEVMNAYNKAENDNHLVFIIESSGAGQFINNVLRVYFPGHIKILLHGVNDKELKKRCVMRNEGIESVRSFNTNHRRIHGVKFTQAEALDKIIEIKDREQRRLEKKREKAKVPR